MATVKEHYDDLLAEYYSWMFGDYETKVESSLAFFRSRDIRPIRAGVALDLGAGSGFQSVALARLGFRVLAVDLCRKLLDELEDRCGNLPVTAIQGDIVEFPAECTEPIELCVCMGDTLPHLESIEQVARLIRDVHGALASQGVFVLTFRDLSFEVTGLSRFIPVKSDENRILTCFLEYMQDHVVVHDLIHVRSGGRWNLRKSCYSKLRLPLDPLLEFMEQCGFIIEECGNNGGMITIIAAKSS